VSGKIVLIITYLQNCVTVIGPVSDPRISSIQSSNSSLFTSHRDSLKKSEVKKINKKSC